MLVIGAGPVGLGVARALKRRATPFDQVEATDHVGGNWAHGVFSTTHIITSKKTTQFADFPMPDHYPDFPSAQQLLEYLEAYADDAGLRDDIEFNTKVERVSPEGDHWRVQLGRGPAREYKGVIISNGHHWDRRWPEYPGKFSGEVIHSKDYRRPEQLAGKRVLVIGGGNSACDIVSEAARVAASAHLSQRRGYWIIPKTMFGRPSIELLPSWMPEWGHRLMLRALLRCFVGRYEDYGLQRPDHRIFETHPTVNSELLYYLKHGKVVPHRDVAHYDGSTVHFVDGTTADIDLIVCATGYHVSYPMLEPDLVEVRGPVPQVYGGMMTKDHRHLYLFGWSQTRLGFGPLVTSAAELLCDVIEVQDRLRHPIGEILWKLGDAPPRTHLKGGHESLRRMKHAKRFMQTLPRVEARLYGR